MMYSDTSPSTNTGTYLDMHEHFLSDLLSILEALFPISASRHEKNICKLITR
ncbi:MAG: hypothetical protein ACTSPG_07830 [Candidatus Hodarchaeales archaeon]